MSVLILNYAHPLTESQLARLSELLGEPVEVRLVPSQVDRRRPLAEVAVELADAAGLSGESWQTTPLAINPPALTPAALALLAELHGRCGYFPPILNIRPVEDSTVPRYELAEVLNLQRLREAARLRR